MRSAAAAMLSAVSRCADFMTVLHIFSYTGTKDRAPALRWINWPELAARPGRVQVDTKIVWMKLASLAEGARRASKQLWAKAA